LELDEDVVPEPVDVSEPEPPELDDVVEELFESELLEELPEELFFFFFVSVE
jgi:hypothetical protein